MKKEEERKIMIKAKAKESAKKFNNEIKKATSTAIIAAFSFLIALAWKDVITEYVDKLVAISPLSGKIISAIIITLICVIGMIIITKIFAVKE